MSSVTTTPATSRATTPAPFAPQSPFDDLAADVILRSSDNHDFRVYRTILSLVSPVFKDMFTLPQPDVQSELPVIPVQETGVVLDRMLRFCYPGSNVTIETLDQLREVLEVLISKYDARRFVSLGKIYLRGYIEAHPVSVFAIACYHGWEDVARAAAKESLKLPLRTPTYGRPVELKCITADSYHSLLQYHYLCGTAAQGVTQHLSWIPASCFSFHWFICGSCGDQEGYRLSDGDYHSVSPYFADYLRGVGEVLARTPGETINDPGLLSETVGNLAACRNCRNIAYGQLCQLLSEHLIPKIHQEIEKVVLNLAL
ncbi:hypothetical protein B0H10DRAFT_2429999 [Mycena sp. CBHHK59/15]|nr:hypothetical protein B0H10DRAFT_2429999 [Mycena sp. CBHHK59/15]